MNRPSKPYLFRSLTLRNFMIHRNTIISLAERPITLITGANGSGKTQILDALILALGYPPKRLKKGKTIDLIGPFDKDASIVLQFCNPLVNGKRAIHIPDKELQEWTNTEEMQIVVDLSVEREMEYFLHTKEKKRRILRKEIRSIFESLNIRADNKLAFTEEGTVNIFADQSSKNKLELLLETIGLNIYRENLVNAHDSIEEAAHAAGPLRRKLVIEKEYLKSMERTRALLAQKEEMAARHQALVIEEAWSYVVEHERKLDGLSRGIDQKRKEIREIGNSLHQKEKEKDGLENELGHLQDQIDQIEAKQEKDKNAFQVLKGKKQSQTQFLQSQEVKITQAKEKISRLLASQKDDKEKVRLEQHLLLIQEEKARLQRIIQTVGKAFFSDAAAVERNLLSKAISFYQKAQERKIPLLGPLFSELQKANLVKDEEWPAFSALLGKDLFSFFTSDEKVFEAALALWEEHFKDDYPEIFLALCPKGKKGKAPLSPLVAFLERAGKILPEKGSSQAILAQAQKEDQSIYCDGKLYLPSPAVGGAKPYECVLACRSLSLPEIEDALSALTQYQQQEKEEEKTKRMLAEINQKSAILHLEERIQEWHNEISLTQKEIAQNEEESQKISLVLEENKALLEKFDERKRNREDALDEVEEAIRSLTKREEAAEKIINLLTQEKEEEEQKLVDTTRRAKVAGERPDAIRATGIVSEERLTLGGKLQAIAVSPLSEEDYRNQKTRVERMESELAGTDAHIAALQGDMTKRFQKWHEEVTNKIRGISDSMNELLSALVDGVRLRVDHLKNPEQAGLMLEVQRNQSRWLDLAHLSGGEKVLTVEALILSLHLQTDSPLHAIDECTQRLDTKFKAQSFDMVRKALVHIEKESTSDFSPQFILLAPDTLGVDFKEEMDRYFKRIVLATGKLQALPKKASIVGA